MVSQIDRFTALKWSLWYNDWMTTGRAIIITSCCKMIMVGVTFFMMIVDYDYFTCYSGRGIPLCDNFRVNNVFWRTIPVCIVQIVLLVVTLYVAKIIIHHQKQVGTTIQLPALASSENQENTDEPGEESLEVRRKDSTPDLFYKIPHQTSGNIDLEDVETAGSNGCLPVSNIYIETAKKFLNINIQTLCISFLMIPSNIFYIRAYITGETCNQNNIWLFAVAIYLTVISSLGFSFATYKKLTKN